MVRPDTDHAVRAALDFSAPPPPLKRIHARAHAAETLVRIQCCVFGVTFAFAVVLSAVGILSRGTASGIAMPSSDPRIPTPVASATPTWYSAPAPLERRTTPDPRPAPAPMLS